MTQELGPYIQVLIHGTRLYLLTHLILEQIHRMKQDLPELFTDLYYAIVSIERDQCLIKSNQVAKHRRIIIL
jgi:hypothetical protein